MTVSPVEIVSENASPGEERQSMQVVGTLIIGGGIAGLACARQLADHGHDFLLLTDRLGGRLFATHGAARNLGATYITHDYHQVRRYVRPGRRIRWSDAHFWDHDRFITLFHPRNLHRIPAITRLFRKLLEFRQHHNELRRLTPHVCQAELLQRDPLLRAAVEEPAIEFIRRYDLAEIDTIFCSPIIRSTVFIETELVNTFYYLACLMPILVPTWRADLTRTLPLLTAGCGSRIRPGQVLTLAPSQQGQFIVTTDVEEYRAERVVVATPGHNTREFCPDLEPAPSRNVRQIPFGVLHVLGCRRPEYLPNKLVFLQPRDAPTALVPWTALGHDLVFCRDTSVDLSPYYEQHRVLCSTQWKTAIQLSGRHWRCLSPMPNLYTIGDHNICGLEDSFLTGLYAANQILHNAPPSPETVQISAGIHGVSGQMRVQP